MTNQHLSGDVLTTNTPIVSGLYHRTYGCIRSTASFLWTLIPILLFFILLSIFINSTDRSLRGSQPDDLGSVIGVDYLPRSEEEAEHWGCFDHAVDTADIHWVAGMSVLVNCTSSRDGVYMAIPGDAPGQLEFVCLRPLVPGEVYSVLSGEAAGLKFVVPEPMTSVTPGVVTTPPPITGGSSEPLLSCSLVRQPNGRLTVPFVCTRRSSTVVVTDLSELDATGWMEGYLLTVVNPQHEEVQVHVSHDGPVRVPAHSTARLWFTEGGCSSC